MMSRFSVGLGLCLLASASFARPCSTAIHRSCLKFDNGTSQAATIQCSFMKVAAAAKSSGSTQLDLGWGDGLGAPDPRVFDCQLRYANGEEKSFDFYNPFWGSNIDFTLVSKRQLKIHAQSGWSSKSTDRTVNW